MPNEAMQIYLVYCFFLFFFLFFFLTFIAYTCTMHIHFVVSICQKRQKLGNSFLILFFLLFFLAWGTFFGVHHSQQEVFVFILTVLLVA